MSKTTFTGPVRSGNIINTSGTTLGKNVKNIGSVVLCQSTPITQAGTATAYATPIVLPADSKIIDIYLYIETVWDGAAATFNVGTSVAATELAIASNNSASTINRLRVSAGASQPKVAKWNDIGTSDARIWFLSTNTGAGTGTLIVEYVQESEDS